MDINVIPASCNLHNIVMYHTNKHGMLNTVKGGIIGAALIAGRRRNA
ncbi:hypothetical protein [Methanococcoides sp. NM1]|nr:hypothetical protein [Methanococcoides sp. NM1]